MKIKRVLAVVMTVCMLIGLCCGASVSAVTYKNLGLDVVNLSETSIEASLQRLGNTTRLANVMKRAAKGEEITIAFIGGSITFGSGSGGSNQERFSELALGWFQEKFPKAKVNLINAGYPATGSTVGLFRSEEEIFQYEPDLLVVEFAVNEGSGLIPDQSSEALIRHVMRQDNEAAAMFLTMCKSGGNHWHDANGKVQIAGYYDLPIVNYYMGAKKAEEMGEINMLDFDGDGTHINTLGHAAVGLYLINYFEKVYADYQSAPDHADPLPAPLNGDPYNHVLNVNNKVYQPKSLGSFKIDDEAGTWNAFKHGWSVHDGGKEPIVFEVEANRVWVAIQRTPSNDGKVLVKVNGVPTTLMSSRADYDQIGYEMVYDGETTKKLTIEISVEQGVHFELIGLWIGY